MPKPPSAVPQYTWSPVMFIQAGLTGQVQTSPLRSRGWMSLPEVRRAWITHLPISSDVSLKCSLFQGDWYKLIPAVPRCPNPHVPEKKSVREQCSCPCLCPAPDLLSISTSSLEVLPMSRAITLVLYPALTQGFARPEPLHRE